MQLICQSKSASGDGVNVLFNSQEANLNLRMTAKDADAYTLGMKYDVSVTLAPPPLPAGTIAAGKITGGGFE